MSNFSKPKIVKSILAIVVVFLMTAGAFMGAAENGSIPDESKDVEALLPSISVAEPTFDDQEERIEASEGIEFEGIEPGYQSLRNFWRGPNGRARRRSGHRHISRPGLPPTV